MELIYIYIKKFKSIENKEFNFSPKFKCTYNKKANKVECDELDWDLGEDFFGKRICNITAILGKNGSGKTNLIEAILISLQLATTNEESQMVSVSMSSEGKMVMYSSFTCGSDPRIKTLEEYRENNEDEIFDEKSRHKVLYYSSIFDGSTITLNTAGNYIDLSTNKLMRDVDTVNSYVSEELIRILNFISSGFGLIESNFKYPNQLAITNSEIHNILELKKAVAGSIYHDLIDLLVPEITDESQKDGKLLKLLAYYAIYSIEKDITSIIEEEKKKEAIYEYLITRDELPLIKLVALIIYFSSFSKRKYSNIFTELVTLSKLETTTDLTGKQTSFDDLKDVIRFISKLNLQPYPFEYSWYYNDQPARISTGEKMFLSLFSRIYDKNKHGDNDRLTTIILDEPDLGFHPEWQKKFLKYLINFIENEFSQYKNVQIIITSHSPFIASDLPNDNVIYLGAKENYNPKTFAANIHELLADSFFMNDGLVGEFAKKKVKEVIEHLRNNKKPHLDKDYVYSIIDMIGEPTVREKLLDEYLRVYDIQRNERIEILRRELNNLESEEND